MGCLGKIQTMHGTQGDWHAGVVNRRGHCTDESKTGDS